MTQTASIVSADPFFDEEPQLSSAGAEGAERRAFRVDAALHGERLDRALALLVPEFSRSYLRQLIEDGAVYLGNAAVPCLKPAQRMRAGQTGSVELREPPQAQAFRPEPIALDTVYLDQHLRVLNKPAGLVVHPAPGHWSGTLLNGLLACDPAAAGLPRAGIVHRLDKDTSGLMLVARTRVAMEALVRAIAAREVRRRYLALAHGRWRGAAERRIDAPVGRDPRNRLRMAVVDLARHPGKSAVTDVELLQQADAGCWLRCTLQTGRTHQIRVHLASIGHPLVADALYAGAPAAGLARQALHAASLALAHPVGAQALQFDAPPPSDMAAALALWGLRADAA